MSTLNKNGDPILQLPVDQNTPTNDEIQIVNTVFKKYENTANVIFVELKDSIIVGVLFIILSIPQVDDIIKKYIPMTSSSYYMLILVKTLILMVLFWVIKHFYLSKK